MPEHPLLSDINRSKQQFHSYLKTRSNSPVTTLLQAQKKAAFATFLVCLLLDGLTRRGHGVDASQ